MYMSNTRRLYKKPASSIPTDGLVAYYPFNGNANDESGNGHNGTVTGATLTTDRKGNANSAYHFNTNQYINTGANIPTAINSTAKLTISAWVKTSSSSDFHSIIVSRNGTGNIIGLSIPNQFYAQLANNSGNWYYTVSPSSYNNGSWHHIVMTYNGSVLSLYIDGNLIASNTFNINLIVSQSFYIGYDTAFGRYMVGDIDDIRIYNRALTQSEVTLLYNE